MTARRASIAKSAVATGRGDDGTTGLLYGGRIPKDDPRTEAYGAVDEAVAALGTARIELTDAGCRIWRRSYSVYSASCSWSGQSWPRIRRLQSDCRTA